MCIGFDVEAYSCVYIIIIYVRNNTIMILYYIISMSYYSAEPRTTVKKTSVLLLFKKLPYFLIIYNKTCMYNVYISCLYNRDIMLIRGVCSVCY